MWTVDRDYGQVLVVLTLGMLLPFMVASTVNLYCKPLVTALLALWVRLPTPEAYQVAIQVEPSHSWIVAEMLPSEVPESTRVVQLAVVPLKERTGRAKEIRAGLACAVVKNATSSNSAKRIDAFLMGFTSFLCVFTLSNDEACRFWTHDLEKFLLFFCNNIFCHLNEDILTDLSGDEEEYTLFTVFPDNGRGVIVERDIQRCR